MHYFFAQKQIKIMQMSENDRKYQKELVYANKNTFGILTSKIDCAKMRDGVSKY